MGQSLAGDTLVCHLPTSHWTYYTAQQTFPERPPSARRCQYWEGPLTSAGTDRVLMGSRDSCCGGQPIGLLPLLTPRTPGLFPCPLLSQLHGPFTLQLPLTLTVPCGAQLGLHRGQLVSQLCIHQQEALQLLLQLWAEQRIELVGESRNKPCPTPLPVAALTASVSWLRCSKSRLYARSSSRCRSVTSLSCRSRARSSEEGVVLAAAHGR